MDQREAAKKNKAIDPFDNWPDFCEELDSAFGDPNPEDMAQTKL